MLKSKLLDVFFCLSKSQRRSLRKFIQSPYYNYREDVLALFEYIHANDLADREALTKEAAFGVIFPNEVYDADKMDYTMSFLLKLLEAFLITEQRQQDEISQQLALAQQYRNLGLEKHFQQSIRQVRQMHQRLTYRDLDYWEKSVKIEMEDYTFTAKQKRHTPRNLQTLSDSFDLQYLTQRLQYTCLLVAHQYVYKAEYDTGTLPYAVEYVEKNPKVLDNAAVALYYYYYKSIVNTQDVSLFQHFKNLLLLYTNQLNVSEMYNLYLFAINYCIQQFNLGNDELLPQAFELYKSGIEHHVLLENGHLSPFSFKNITDIALRLKETDWAEQFIARYQHLLDNKNRTTYTHYALCKLRYQQKKYKEAMLHLHHLEQGDLFLILSGKTLLLKIYYELGEYDALDALLSSFQIFVHRRKELTQTRRDNYKNIIRFTRKLLHLNVYDQSERQKLATEIRQTRQLTERDWLLAQLEK